MDWRDKNAVCVPCPYCGGTGHALAEINEGGDVERTFSESEAAEYTNLPADRQETTECPHCEGWGNIFLDD